MFYHFPCQLRISPEATAISPPRNPAEWFNTTIRLDKSVLDDLKAQQAEYPVPWGPLDSDAPWLGNRLLLFIYVTQVLCLKKKGA